MYRQARRVHLLEGNDDIDVYDAMTVETSGCGISVQQTDKEERPYGGTSSARQAVVKRSSCARHFPGKVVGWELQANTSFHSGLTAAQAPQKFVGLGNAI
eukprot:12664611-Heterocapsa_arctica.AAC.1